jgi:hypothetical protein
MTGWVVQDGRVLVRPDLPTEKVTGGGIILPKQDKADHFERDADGYMKAYRAGEYQVVSGIVVAASGNCTFDANLMESEVSRLQISGTYYQPGIVSCTINYAPPRIGDRVWFGWRTWSALESEGMVVIDGDGMIGNMDMARVYLRNNDEEGYNAVGPCIMCEPIPEMHTEGLVKGKLGQARNSGIARFAGHASHNPVCGGMNDGDAVYFSGPHKAGMPVPFSTREWIRVPAERVVAVNPPWLQVPADLNAAWEAVKAHNNAIAMATKGMDFSTREYNPLTGVDWDRIDYLRSMEEKRIAEFKKTYKSRWI